MKQLEKKHKHISKTHKGYIIRITQNGNTYYYGCYPTLQEAITTEQKLSKHQYSTRLSQQHNHRKGNEYNKWLQEKLGEREKG